MEGDASPLMWAIVGVSCLSSIVNLVCIIMVLIRLFQREGVGLGILGLFCFLYTFIWGWQHADDEGLTPVMATWTLLFLLGIVLQGATAMLGA